MLTKGAIVNLVNRYRAVLKKCRLMNVFGSLAAAGILIAGLTDAAFATQGSLINGDYSFTDYTTVEADQCTEGNRRAGIIASSGSMTVNVSDGKLLTVKSTAQSSDERVYGAVSQDSASLKLSGDASFSLVSESQQARIFRANGGNIDINGTISGTAVTKKGQINGVEVWDGATASFSGNELSIDLQSESGLIYGVTISDPNGGTINFNSEKTTISIEAGQNSTKYATGVYSYSATNFTGNTEISVIGGQAYTFGLNAEGTSVAAGTISFSGDSTVIDVTGTMMTFAVSPSGPGSSISFTGETAEIKATSLQGIAFGIEGQYGADLTATADVAVTVQAEQDAYGVALMEYGDDDDYYAGNADFDGSLTVSATSENANAYGVYNSTVEVAEGHTEDGKLSVAKDSVISATAKGNAYGVYTAGSYAENTLEGNTEIKAVSSEGESAGIFAEQSSSVSVAADKEIAVTAISSNSLAIGIRASSGSQLSFSGDTISISVESDTGRVSGTRAEGNSQLSFSGDELNIDVKSNSGRATGVRNYNNQGAACNFDSKKTTISVVSEETGKDSAQYVQGVQGFQSTTSFTGDTEITVKGGKEDTYGINVECDPGNTYDTVITFAGDNTVIDVTGTNVVYAVRPSGVPGSINFTGETAEIKATSLEGEAYGIRSQYGADLNATADVAVTVQAAEGAYGVTLKEYGYTDDYYAGNADFDGDLTVSATSENAEAFGVYNSTVEVAEGHTEDGKFSVAGDSVISAVSENGDAYGVYTIGSYAENSFEGDTDIQAVASEGTSYGILAEDSSSMSLGSEGSTTKISATGATSTAVAVSSSSLSITGSKAEIAADAQDGSAYGILAQDGSDLAITADTDVTAEAAAKVTGIALYASDAADDSYVSIDGNLSVTAQSAGSDAFGVGIQAEDASSAPVEDGKLSVSGDSTLSATAEKGSAYGLYAAGENAVASVGGSTDIQAAAPEGNSYGIYAEDSSSISLGSDGSTAKITATGSKSIAVLVSNSSLSITGDTAEIGATAQGSSAYGILAQDGAEIAITADTAVTAEAAEEAFGIAPPATDVADDSYVSIEGNLSAIAKSAASVASGVFIQAEDGSSAPVEKGKLTVSGDGVIEAVSEKDEAFGIYAVGSNAVSSTGGSIDITVAAPEGTSAGIYAESSSSISLGSEGSTAKITATGAESTAVNVSNSSLSITGATAELSATAQKSYAYGILAQNGSELAIKADTAVTANAAGDAIGVALIANEASKTNYAGNADITGSLSVSAKSANSDAYGVYNPAEDGASGHSEYGRLTVSGDGDIEAASEKGDAFGIYATGESAVTSIGGSTDIQAAAPEGYSIGIVTENSSSMSLGSEKSTAKISATGAQSYAVAVRTSSLSLTGTTAEINATAQKDYAYGILSLDGSDLAIAADTAVTAEAAGEAFGVALLANDVPDTSYAGNAEITGDLSVSAKSANSDAYGVYNPAADGASGHDEYGTLTVSGDGDISATAENGDAYGIFATGENAETSIGGNTTIEASAPEGKSYGVLARKAARLSMGGDGASTTITATGADSTAVALEDTSSMSVTGATALEADKALSGSGTISNTGDLEVVRGTVDSFTGTYTQNSGSTSLTSDSNFFGGDVTIKKGSLTVGDIDTSAASGADSILGLGNSIEVQPGKNLLIGTDSGTGVVFGAESALVVNGIAAAQSPMITGSGTITVEAGSQLYITNAKASQAYTITKGLTGDSYWTEANLVLNNLIKVSLYRDGDAFVVKTSVKDLNTVFPGIIPSNALTTMLAQGLNDTDSSYMGIRFLSRATEPLYMSDNARAVDTVNEVSRAAVTAGVQNTSMRLADAAADTVMKHLSLASFDSENSIHKDGIDVWATPMYGNTWTHDMSTSVCGNYGGLAIGADVHLGTLAGGNVRAGIAVSGGGGHSKTRDNVTSTDNSYNFGGVSLYGGWTLDNLNIMASVGYNMGRHELEMSLPSSLGMGSAEADVYTRAFTADLRAEYLFKTDFLDIMPHIGVRYTALYTDDYDLEVNNSRLNSVESGMQNIVQFPVGVTFSKDIAVSGWIVKPQVDLAVVPAVGDLGAVSEISWSGINATDDVSTRIMDTVSYTGRAGIQAEMGNFAIGLNYGIQAAKHETNHSLNAGFTWKF